MICEDGVKNYCCEATSKIKNYDKAIADTNQMWDCHHKLEMFYTRQELIDNNRYYNVPARELVFLTRKEHRWWPHKGYEEFKEKISKALKGRIFSEEAKKKMSISHKGKHHSEETKAKLSCPVVQCNAQTGEVIAEFPSAIDAYRQTGIWNIQNCCNGRRKSAGGYVWQYK